MSKITNNILNIITSISLLLLIYNLFVLREIQPAGYTINIYEQLPFHFFLTLLFCYLSACVMLLAYRKMSAVFILFLVHITVIITPYMLGHISVGRGEEFSYMGLVGEGGLLGISNLSPTGPLFVSPLVLVSGLEPWIFSYLLPVLFSILFISGMFLFYREFMSREKLVLVTFLSSLIPYFGHFEVSTFPYYLCFCLVPLYLFVLRNTFAAKSKKMAICFLFMMPLIPLAHPFIFAYLICFSLSLAISGTVVKQGLLHKILSSNFLLSASSQNVGKKIPIFLVLSLTSVSLLLFSKYGPSSINILLSTFPLNTKTSVAPNFFGTSGIDNSFFEFIHFFNLLYGKYYIPLILIVINSIIVWQNRKRFCQHFVHRYPRFLVLYILTFFMELGFILNPFIPYPPDRFSNLSFIIFAQIPLLGYSLYIIFLRKGYILGLGSAVMVLCLLWTLGFFTCFSSPYTGGISEVVSQSEVKGVQWLTEVNGNYPYIMPFEDKEINDLSSKKSSTYLTAGFTKDSHSPGNSHKNNSEELTSSENSVESEPFYLVVTTFSEALKLDKRESERVSIRDIQKDYPVYKIYDSLNIEIFKHNP